MVEGNHVVYRISAPSPEEKEEWMKSIRCAGPGGGARGVGGSWGGVGQRGRGRVGEDRPSPPNRVSFSFSPQSEYQQGSFL